MNNTTLDYWKSQLDEIWLDAIKSIHRNKDIDQVIEYAYLDLLSQPERLNTATASDFKRLVNSWLSNRKAEQIKVDQRERMKNL
jgi:hypothetical protein